MIKETMECSEAGEPLTDSQVWEDPESFHMRCECHGAKVYYDWVLNP